MDKKGKRWVDIDEVVKASSMPEELKKLDEVMREIPKHNKVDSKKV